MSIPYHKIRERHEEGRKAEAGSTCPYGTGEIGFRCAWLAGHFEAHGEAAWDKARG